MVFLGFGIPMYHRMGSWQAYLTSALALRGGEVRGTAEGITIAPWKACAEG